MLPIIAHGPRRQSLMPGTFDQLTNLATPIFVLFWTLSGIALFVLRRKLASTPRPFRVPAYPFVPLAFVLIMAGILVSAVIESPAEARATFALLALGLPLYPRLRCRCGPARARRGRNMEKRHPRNLAGSVFPRMVRAALNLPLSS